jgi:large subunit ribosomal protein L30
MSTKSKQVKIQLVRSTIGRLPRHKASVKGLGLRRMHHTVIVQDTPANRGMINQVAYLLKIEELTL